MTGSVGQTPLHVPDITVIIYQVIMAKMMIIMFMALAILSITIADHVPTASQFEALEANTHDATGRSRDFQPLESGDGSSSGPKFSPLQIGLLPYRGIWGGRFIGNPYWWAYGAYPFGYPFYPRYY